MILGNPSDRYTLAIRRLVFLLLLVRIAFDPFQELATLSAVAFVPTAPIDWLPRSFELLFLDYYTLLVVRIAGAMAAAVAMLGIGFRFAAPVCCVIATLHQSIVRGFGHINHAEICLLLIAYVFALGAWTKGKKNNPEPLAAALVLTIPYMLIGAYRLSSGPEVFLSDSIVHWFVSTAVGMHDIGFSMGWHIVDYPVLWPFLKLSFFIVTIIEATAPLALINRPFRLVFLLAMAGFHVGTLIVMNILFLENMILLAALIAVPHFFHQAANRTQPVSQM